MAIHCLNLVIGNKMDKNTLNSYIRGAAKAYKEKEETLKESIKKCKKDLVALEVKLECDHEIEREVCSDYYGKVTTYRCKKCHYSVEF
jgi:rubrerythrin